MHFVNTVLVSKTEDEHYIIEFGYRYIDSHGAERHEEELPLVVVSRDGLREIIDELRTALDSAGLIDEL